MYKLTCLNCGNHYIGRMNGNCKTRFKEHTDFIYDKGHSNFANHLIEEGHDIKKYGRYHDGTKTIN